MASTQTARKTTGASGEPTGAQRATIATLADKLGVEAPEPESADEATEMIGKLNAALEERSEEPPTTGATNDDDDEKPAETDDGTAKPPTDTGLSMEETHKRFDRAVAEFGKSLREVFGVETLEPSQTPGVVGFLMPGFTEELPHDNFTRCTTCNGYGDVLTGSTKAGNERRPCPDPRCKGLGFWQKAGAPEPVQPTLIPVPQAADNGLGGYAPAPTWLGDPNLTNGA